MTETSHDTDERAEAATRPTGPAPMFPPPAPRRALRRSRTDRAGIGLCGGLGEYFGVDPVLFRVLFVVLSFFGGVGIFAYLAGYALVPEEGAPDSAADRFVAQLRRRRISPLAFAVVAGLLLWALLFSWWLPDAFPATVVLVGLIVYLAMRHRGDVPPPPSSPGSGSAPWPPPDADVPRRAPNVPAAEPVTIGSPGEPHAVAVAEPPKGSDSEAHIGRTGRRSVLVATLATLAVTWGGLAVLDIVTAVPIKVFAWSGLAIVSAGIIVGLVWRRLPWSLLVLVVPMIAGVAVFGASEARFDDGVGDRAWIPSSAAELRSDYALAFGRAVLDLTDPALELSGQSVRLDLGAGEVVVRVPADVDITFAADVQAGATDLDGQETRGWGLDQRYVSAGSGTEGGPSVVLDVELGAGVVRLERVGG